MTKSLSPIKLALRIWLLTNTFFAAFLTALNLFSHFNTYILIIALPIGLFVTLPALIVLWLCIALIKKYNCYNGHAYARLAFVCLLLAGAYSYPNYLVLNVIIDHRIEILENNQFLVSIIHLTASICLSILTSKKYITQSFHQPQKNNNMEQKQLSENVIESNFNQEPHAQKGNKSLTKVITMAVLVLALLIPTLFISNLVEERKERQQEVVKEVSSKWASNQTIGAPFIHLPYTTTEKVDKKEVTVQKNLFLLPQNLNISGELLPEIRPRSIYKVHLYKSKLQIDGNFVPSIPDDISLDKIDFSKAKICFLLNDVKGIEEKLSVLFNGNSYDLSVGLPFTESVNDFIAPKIVRESTDDNYYPATQVDLKGLSIKIKFTKEMLNQPLAFSMNAKINGSESLKFLPMAANSSFKLNSSWNNPKFDGNKVPNERVVNDSGFKAKWNFNSANLPFGTVLKEFVVDPATFAFGVSMVQPADHYAKTNRCIKYAILFISLSFALFFIIEMMQKNPLHPIQYLLVGVALLIFFTLLLSISEFLLFDFAYAIAASCIVALISLYAYWHFKKLKTALVFTFLIGALYTFIFVLIRLEDTALLIGSIGLFAILSLAMYASRKINWYNKF